MTRMKPGNTFATSQLFSGSAMQTRNRMSLPGASTASFLLYTLPLFYLCLFSGPSTSLPKGLTESQDADQATELTFTSESKAANPQWPLTEFVKPGQAAGSVLGGKGRGVSVALDAAESQRSSYRGRALTWLSTNIAMSMNISCSSRMLFSNLMISLCLVSISLRACFEMLESMMI
ncbi:putative methyltransferase WBSCR22-like protein [Cricetulus griseus]|uniref:Putative methyltransferase WBSCR22-like protein n=1 Tax=Cricetulus griseus TaxID=10029 RepID=A0A061I1Z1_CRIGR|nr:putative methyltransferase WBSCR22-like protein [Cricetulus griseus]